MSRCNMAYGAGSGRQRRTAMAKLATWLAILPVSNVGQMHLSPGERPFPSCAAVRCLELDCDWPGPSTMAVRPKYLDQG
jgi:hypothetical protein